MKIQATVKQLKSDIFGTIEMVRLDDGRLAVCRDINSSFKWVRPLAYYLALREKKCLEALKKIDDDRLPRILSWGEGRLIRTYIEAEKLYDLQPRNPNFYENAKELLDKMHNCGVVHNDLAKEANWLAVNGEVPALTDFQLALVFKRKGLLFRMFAREDHRHLLKHKRTYCPEHLSEEEKEKLKNKAIATRIYMKTIKPVYNFITRAVLHYSDRGKGAKRSP